MLRKIIKYSLGLFLVLLLLGLLISIFFIFKTRTPTTGVIKGFGLAGKVTIQRDAHGVPHITALKSDLDAFYALGFVHAQDRFWQMDFQRHVAEGRLSEIFGSRTISEDKYLRTWGFYRAAKLEWQHLDPRTKAILDHYTEGVNAFLRLNHFPIQVYLLRYKPKPWTDLDSLVWQKIMAWDLQTDWQREIVNYAISQKFSASQIPVLQPPYPNGAPVITNTGIPDQVEYSNYLTSKITSMRRRLGIYDLLGKGSNNWVIAGKWTASGKPLLANDPHLDLNAPSLWYLAELRGPHLHVTGATIPGFPAVEIGHNDMIAWGVTNVDPNTVDLYVEPDNAHLKTIIEPIKVKGGKTINYPVKISKHGPILSSVVKELAPLGKNVALKWTALMPVDTTAEGAVRLDYARNWQDFKYALQHYITPVQNFVYADIKGNIGYYMPGKIPIRHGWDGSMPVLPGQHHEWAGYIPFAKLPHLYNPPTGVIATANNKIVSSNYPYQINFRWKTPPYRVERILDLLHNRKGLTREDMKKIQLDTMSYYWRSLKPYLLKTQAQDKYSRMALQLLRNWHGQMTIDSKAATIFAYWTQQLDKMMPGTIRKLLDSSEPLFVEQQLASNGVYCKQAGFSSCHDFLSNSLKNAMQNLIKNYGSSENNWRWGKAHKAAFSELGIGQVKFLGWLWNQSIATPGGKNTVNVGTYNDAFAQVTGPGYRQIIDFSDLQHSLYITAPGQTDAPWSAHQHDLLKMWRDGQYLKINKQHLKKPLVLLP